jgi:hypothetical protein
MEMINSTDPGPCINIETMLRAPTSLRKKVWISWGKYWIAARVAAQRPRNVAHLATGLSRNKSVIVIVKTVRLEKSQVF